MGPLIAVSNQQTVETWYLAADSWHLPAAKQKSGISAAFSAL